MAATVLRNLKFHIAIRIQLRCSAKIEAFFHRPVTERQGKADILCTVRCLPSVITAVIVPVLILKIPHSWFLRKCLVFHWLTLSINTLNLKCKRLILAGVGKNLGINLFFTLNYNMRPLIRCQQNCRTGSIFLQIHQLHADVIHQL